MRLFEEIRYVVGNLSFIRLDNPKQACTCIVRHLVEVTLTGIFLFRKDSKQLGESVSPSSETQGQLVGTIECSW